MDKKTIRKYIENNAGSYFRAMFYSVIGHLLLLISAIYERGETELSRFLLPRASQTGEMIDAVFASAVILLAGWLIINYLFITDKSE